MSETTSRMVEAAFKAPQIPEWERHRSTITRLYVEEERPLKEVMSILHDQHGFQATPRQYKRRISAWNLHKNKKSEDIGDLLQNYTKDELENAVSTSKDFTLALQGRRLSRSLVMRHLRQMKGTKVSPDPIIRFSRPQKAFRCKPLSTPSSPQSDGASMGDEPVEEEIDSLASIRSQLSTPSSTTPFLLPQDSLVPESVSIRFPSPLHISTQTSTVEKSSYDYDEEASDARHKRRKISNMDSTSLADTRPLACPFYKHNPRKYNPSAIRYRSCAGPGWESISRLRQHLFRAHRCDPVLAKNYELHSFTKRDNCWVADDVKIAAPQEELAKAVSDRERNSLLLRPLENMDPGRRAVINELLERKNLDGGDQEAQFRCASVESFNISVRADDGKQIREDEKMDVIIAQQTVPHAGRASEELISTSENITDEQEQQLKQKQPPRLTREENWQRIYHVLFPWDSKSPSSYYDSRSDASTNALSALSQSEQIDSLVQHLCKTLPQKILTGLRGQQKSGLDNLMKSPTGTAQPTANNAIQQSSKKQKEQSTQDASIKPRRSPSADDLKTFISDSVVESCTEWLKNSNEQEDHSDQELVLDDEQHHAVSRSTNKAYDIWSFDSLAGDLGGDVSTQSYSTLSGTLVNFDQPQTEETLSQTPPPDGSLAKFMCIPHLDSNLNIASASSYDFSYLPMSPGIPFLDPSAELEWEPATTTLEDMEREPTNFFGPIESESTTTSTKDTGTFNFRSPFRQSPRSIAVLGKEGARTLSGSVPGTTTVLDIPLNPDP